MKVVPLIYVPPDDNQTFLTAALFGRGLSSLQSAIILAERGITGDARTAARSLLETVFYLGALRKDTAFAEELIADDFSRRQKLARALLRLPDGLDDPDKDKLSDFLKRMEESDLPPEEVKIFMAARKAELEDIYNTYYRGLSNDAAHPSVTALNRHVEADANGVVTGLKFGPAAADVGDTVLAICTGAVYLIHLTNQMLAEPGVTTKFGECWAEYKRLVHATAQKEGSAPKSGATPYVKD